LKKLGNGWLRQSNILILGVYPMGKAEILCGVLVTKVRELVGCSIISEPFLVDQAGVWFAD